MDYWDADWLSASGPKTSTPPPINTLSYEIRVSAWYFREVFHQGYHLEGRSPAALL